MDIREIINNSKRIVFLTGAGISTASGIPDFRSAKGLYNQKYKYRPETILSRTFFDENTEDFFEFYRDKLIIKSVLPNDAHLAIAELEEKGKIVTVITQNIDGLHQLAGSTNVLELHGGIKNNYCMKCARHYDLDEIIDMTLVPKCECGGVIKPDVVLYEECLNQNLLTQAVEEIISCDTLVICGTSMQVNPAAGLARFYQGSNLVLINLTRTEFDQYCDLVIREPIEKVLKFILGEEDAK